MTPIKLILTFQRGGIMHAGFASSEALLVPYKNVRYRLSEWSYAKEV
jgi:hypothetical protein